MRDIITDDITIKLNNSIYNGNNVDEYEQIALKLNKSRLQIGMNIE